MQGSLPLPFFPLLPIVSDNAPVFFVPDVAAVRARPAAYSLPYRVLLPGYRYHSYLPFLLCRKQARPAA